MAEWASLAVGWLLAYLVHSSLLLASVFLVERLGRIRSGALLTGLWRAAFFGAIVTASLQTILATSPLQGRLPIASAPPVAQRIPMQSVAADRLLPKPGIFVPPSETVRMVIAGAPPTLHAAAGREQATPAKLSVFTALATWLGRSWPWLAVVAWFAVALALLARVGFGARAAGRELAGRIRLREGSAFEALAALAREAGDRHPPRLSVSASLAGPVSLPNGEVVLPSWTLERLAPNQLRALFAHELAHCRRRDPQWQLAATLTGALLFFQPFNWLARARLAAGAELASDDWAAARTGDRRGLAECLVECAARLRASYLPDFASAMAAPGSQLMHRVARLTGGIRTFNGEIGMKHRIAIIVPLAVAAFLAPGFLISPSFAASSAPSSSSAASAAASAQAQAKLAVRQAAIAREQTAEAAARANLQKTRAKLVARRTQLEAGQRAMQKSAESMRKQAEATRKQAEMARRKQQQAQAELVRRKARLEAHEAAMEKAEAARQKVVHKAEAKRHEAEWKAEAAMRQTETRRKEAEKATRKRQQAEAKATQARLEALERAKQKAKVAEKEPQAEAREQAEAAKREQQKAEANAVRARHEAEEHAKQKTDASETTGR